MAFTAFRFIKLLISNATDSTKQLLFDVSDSATTNTTTTLRSTQTSNKTIELPDVAGVLESQANKGVANGYASLDGSTLLTEAQNRPDLQKYANLAAFPLTGNIKLIYLAEDTKKLYEWTGSVYAEIGGSGSGDVVGPASSVDNTLPRFDGTSGKIIQSSSVVVSDGNAISGLAGVETSGSVRITNQGILRLDEQSGSGTEFVSLRAPESIASSITWDLPSTIGNVGQVLTRVGPGAGDTSWEDIPSTSGDWQSITITGSWVANTTYTALQLDYANNIVDLQINVATSGSPTSANLTIDLPFTIDTSRLVGVGPFKELGSGNTSDSDVSGFTCKAFYLDTNTINIMYMDGAGVTTQVTQAAPQTWAAGDSLNITIYSLPIIP